MAYELLGSRLDRPAGIRYSIAVDIAEVQRALSAYPQVSRRAIARALNRTASSTLTVARRALQQKIGLPNQKLLKNRMGYTRAKVRAGALMESNVHISSRGILASQLGAVQTPLGLSYRLGGKTILIRHGFLARGQQKLGDMYGGQPYSFIRQKTGPGRDATRTNRYGLVPRLPVEYAWGANPVAAFMSAGVFDAMERRAAERWPIEIGHQVHYYIDRYIPRGLL